MALNLRQKLLLVMKDCGSIQKTGYNQAQNYQYVKEEDVVTSIRESLCKHNVFISQSVMSIENKDVVIRDKNATLTNVTVQYRILDAESDETIVSQAFGVGLDYGDKGLYKALTGAHKYFLMKNFNLSTGDDPESDETFDKEHLNAKPVVQPKVKVNTI